MNTWTRLFAAAATLACLTAVSLGGGMGCNTEEVAGHGDDDDVVGTEQDAKDAALAAENVALRSFVASFGSPGAALVSDDQASFILDRLKNVLEASSRSSCPKGSVPSPSGGDVTVTGGVRGVCAARFEGDASDGTVRANCTDYHDGVDSGEAEVNGLIAAEGSAETVGDQSTFTFSSVTSNLLTLILADGDDCSAVVNLSADVTIDNGDGSGSVAVEGCVSICGESFDVTGSDTF